MCENWGERVFTLDVRRRMQAVAQSAKRQSVGAGAVHPFSLGGKGVNGMAVQGLMCSLRFSPVPRPRKKRPGIMAAAVAAAWAMMPGWIRMVGHVTPIWMRDVTGAKPVTRLRKRGLYHNDTGTGSVRAAQATQGQSFPGV